MKTNTDIVNEGYAFFKQGNIPALLDLMSDDIVWELPVSAEVPFAGTFKGKSRVLEFFQAVGSTNEFKEFEVDTIVSNGNHVVALGHLTSVARPTGKQSSNKWAHHWHLQDGKVISHYEYVDTAEINNAFH